jgi:hypothetical protein
MPIKKVAHRTKMAKKGTKKQALIWVPSSFDQTDLRKAKKEGFLPESVAVVFPSDERVAKLPAGYRVMFLALLLRGLSLPAHEFLRGLLFLYALMRHGVDSFSPSSWEPQEEGMMNIAASFPSVKNQGLSIRRGRSQTTEGDAC